MSSFLGNVMVVKDLVPGMYQFWEAVDSGNASTVAYVLNLGPRYEEKLYWNC